MAIKVTAYLGVSWTTHTKKDSTDDHQYPGKDEGDGYSRYEKVGTTTCVAARSPIAWSFTTNAKQKANIV
uniref:Uncharacterized protein n=1 Tax=Arion vulgaris TaxID=1028688 RepID=A0A0B7B9Q2_9EUPU